MKQVHPVVVVVVNYHFVNITSCIYDQSIHIYIYIISSYT
jgi:hypothetical protein